MAVRFKHVYIVQKKEKDDANTYIATLPGTLEKRLSSRTFFLSRL